MRRRGLLALVGGLAVVALAAAAVERGIARRAAERRQQAEEQRERDAQGEKLYAEAMALITARRNDDYDRAETLLRQIDRGAKCWGEAQGVRAWLAADLKVREARREYNLGNAPRGIQLLDEVLMVPEIGREAQETVRQRKELWTKVRKAFEAGQEAYKAQDGTKAERLLAEVLRLETSSENRYHVLAKRLVGELAGGPPMGVDAVFEGGVKALDGTRPDFAEAHARFTTVLRNAGADRALYRQRIAKEVEDRSGRGKWLASAQAAVPDGAPPELERAKNVAKLLADFLPQTHSDANAARTLLPRLTQRLVSRGGS